jgi:glyoxylase-like metal-dependent hydrolase (beta-lactamase superfamily II)
MREYLKGIFQEKDLPGVYLGLVQGEGQSLLIDAPLRIDEAKEWVAAAAAAGEPKYLVLLDHNIDRALGARHFDLPCLAHALTSEAMHGWSDTFKGASHPIGAEADGLKRITGIKGATPDVIFDEELLVELPGRPVRLTHRPGPTPGSIWVEVPDKGVAYIGDAVTVVVPPFVGEADLDAWLTTLDRLRVPPYDEFKLLSSRDGLVNREDVNNMARFLRKIPVRIDRMQERVDLAAAAEGFALELVEDFKTPKTRFEAAVTRLEAGLLRLYRRQHPKSN